MILNELKLYNHISEPDANSKVWRYMNLPKFLFLINYSQLFFCRVDKLSDQLEGTLPFHNRRNIQDYVASYHPIITKKFASDYAEKEELNILNFKKYTLVNCWSKNEDESFALWKLYLDGHKFGIVIQTIYKKLKESIDSNANDILFGDVIYDDLVNLVKQSTINFRKNKFYRFENEVRAVIFDQYILGKSKEKLPLYEVGVNIKVDLNNLIEKIYISPLAPDWFYKLVCDIINDKYNFNFLIEKSKIRESL